jgi:hypothetical protein
MAELNFHDNNTIPGMGHMATKFLQVIKNRADEAQIGLSFQPKQDRRSKEVRLEAVITFKSLVGRGQPIRLQVHASPRGNMLNVGYSVTTDQDGAFDQFMGNVNWGTGLEQSMRNNINLRPDNQRELQIIVDSFSQGVYVPTVQDLLDVTQAQRRPDDSGGFLGIR